MMRCRSDRRFGAGGGRERGGGGNMRGEGGGGRGGGGREKVKKGASRIRRSRGGAERRGGRGRSGRVMKNEEWEMQNADGGEACLSPSPSPLPSLPPRLARIQMRL